MKKWLLTLIISLVLAFGAEASEPVKVKSEFLELHTGAGRGFPVVNVVEQGETFLALARKYDWIKVSAGDGVEGWVSYKDFLAATRVQKSSFRKKNAYSLWQLGGRAGLFKKDPYYSLFLGIYPIKNLNVSVEIGQTAGAYSGSTFMSGNMTIAFFREALFSPNFTLGIGTLYNNPRETLVNANKEQYGFFRYGAGVTYAAYKRLALDLNVNNTVVSDIGNYLGMGLAVSVFYD